MSGNPVPLTSGSLSIPSSELMCNENEFGVVQSPYQESYMIGHSRQNTCSILSVSDLDTIMNCLGPLSKSGLTEQEHVTPVKLLKGFVGNFVQIPKFDRNIPPRVRQDTLEEGQRLHQSKCKNGTRVMEPWEKSAIKPIELFKDIQPLPDLPESKPIPDVVITESSSKEMSTLSRNRSVPKMMHIYDEYHEEMFQLDDECDDFMPDVAMFPSLKNRKMSRSTDDLNPLKNQISKEPEPSHHKHLQKFRSDSNLHSNDSNMSLVEKVSLLNLTASKKDIKSSSPTPLLQDNSEDRLGEGNSTLKRWLLTKPVTVSKREMNAIAPFPS